jgi:hypothetical protein
MCRKLLSFMFGNLILRRFLAYAIVLNALGK